MSKRKKKERGEFRDVAEKIAASLFAGYDGKAQRLVLEMPHGKPTGGWSEMCAIGQIEKVLEEYANGGEAVALMSRKNRVGAQLVKGLLSPAAADEPIVEKRICHDCLLDFEIRYPYDLPLLCPMCEFEVETK